MNQTVSTINWPLRILILTVVFVAAAIFAVTLWYVLAYIGMTLIIPLDYLARPLGQAGLDASVGWMIIGCVLGVAIGLGSGYKKVGRPAGAAWTYGVAAVLGFFAVMAAVGENKQLDMKLAAEAAARAQHPPAFVRPNLIGTWSGTLDNRPASLVIHSVKGDEFYGTLTKDRARVAVTGYTSSSSPHLTIRETKVLKGRWLLETNTGTFSDDGRSMSGTRSDSGGAQSSWHFSKK